MSSVLTIPYVNRIEQHSVSDNRTVTFVYLDKNAPKDQPPQQAKEALASELEGNVIFLQ